MARPEEQLPFSFEVVPVQAPPLPQPQANFVAFTRIVLELVPTYLGSYFIMCWNAKYPAHPWLDLPENGELLLNGSLLYDVQLPGTAKMTHGSGKVVPTEDLSGCLQDGDRVMIEGHV